MKKNFANMPFSRKETWRKLELEEDACFKHIDNIESKYIFGKTLGQLPFGVVRVCKHILTNKKFTIKIMKKQLMRENNIHKDLFLKELNLLNKNKK